MTKKTYPEQRELINMNRRQYLVAAGTGSIAAVAGCLGGRADRSLPETPTGSWPQDRHDEANTGNADTTVPPRGNHAWTSEEFTRWKPVAADGEVYIGNVGAGSDGPPVIVALNARDGSERWRVTLDNETSHYASAILEELLVAAYGNQVIAVDRESGNQEWAATLSGTIFFSKITSVPEKSLVLVPFASRDSNGLVAFDATGEQLWSAPLRRSAVDAPAVWGESIYVASGSELRRLNIADGTEDWTRDVGDVPLGPSVTTEGVVVAAGGDLTVHDPMTGEQKRRLDGYDSDRVSGARGVAVAGGTAYWLTHDKLAAVTVADGAVEWRLDTTARQDGFCVGRETVVAPVRYDEFDLETEYDGWPTIAAFDRETGDTRWFYSIDGFDVGFTTPPVLVDGAVYFVSNTISGVGALGDVSPADDSGLF